MKKTWKTINETLSRNKFISELPSTFLHDDLELTDPIEIANAFNATLERLLLLKLRIISQAITILRSI